VRKFSFLLALLLCASCLLAAEKPNIVYILADDLGYGDVSCLNKDSKIKTPNIDRLASQGMIFTDAHSSSAVCSPTRYGIMTGRYAWRTHLRSGVLWGWSKPLIAPERLTVASMLKKEGYRTACFGKWHLGMDWPFENPADVPAWATKASGSPNVDYSKQIKNSPNAFGFDTYYGISASLDMPPYTFIENDHTVGLPIETKTLWKGRPGPANPEFQLEKVLPTITTKAVEFIGRQSKEKEPFCIYMPLNSPHTPIAPNAEFKGKSGISDYADFVMETDWAIGQVMDALEKNGQMDKTLLIVTSDNGCSPEANFKQLAEHGHNPSYIFRGTKSDIFEGGHHIPFIARWPGKIKAGSSCDDTICLSDLMATCAEIVGVKLPDNAGEDSVSILPDFMGTAKAPLREATIHQSVNGSLAVRQGKWKLEMCADSGGWSSPKADNSEGGKLPPVQLYDMTRDVRERHNVEAEHSDIVEHLRTLLEKYIEEGRSTPGTTQKNDVAVPIMIKPKAKTKAE
jgi:arylsulfatase A